MPVEWTPETLCPVECNLPSRRANGPNLPHNRSITTPVQWVLQPPVEPDAETKPDNECGGTDERRDVNAVLSMIHRLTKTLAQKEKSQPVTDHHRRGEARFHVVRPARHKRQIQTKVGDTTAGD
jgi:hypothetical protein